MRSALSHTLTLLLVLFISLSPAEAKKPIIFWTTEDQMERLALQKRLARLFTKKRGHDVQVIPIRENLLADRIYAAKAVGILPDVVYHPIRFTLDWAESGLFDTRITSQVIEKLGKQTFSAGALVKVGIDQRYAAVPIDGWNQLLLYRKDLFDQKGLAKPDSWERIQQAAQTLHQPPRMWGIVMPTAPDRVYTQQVFEHLSLSNGVLLRDTTGKVNIDTPAMIKTLKFYRELTRYTPYGSTYWHHTRKAYVSGRAAMIFWSPYILDELSGFREDLPVLPDIRKGIQGYLARNTGFVSSIKGPNGKAQYSQINCLGILAGTDNRPASQWTTFLMSEAYIKWLAIAPEGKLPMRIGKGQDPTYFLRHWSQLNIGSQKGSRITDFYGEGVLDTILKLDAEGLNYWGIRENGAELVAEIYASKVIPAILSKFLDGEFDVKQTARKMNQEVKALTYR